MGTPKDWLRESRGIGTFTPPTVTADTMQAPFDPFDDVGRMRRDDMARREREEYLEEQAEERQFRLMQRQVKQLQLQRQLRELSGDGQQQNGNMEVFREIVREMQSDKRELLDELKQARADNASAINRVLQEQLATMQKRIEQVVAPRETETDPIGKLVRDLQAVHTVREALDTALPQRAPSEAQSRSERLEQLRIDKEYELRKMEADAQIEAARAQRESAQADRDMKAHRMERASRLVEDVLGPVLANVAGDKIGGLAGGGGGGGGAAADVAQAPQIQVRCPNPECNEVLSVAEGTQFTRCTNCSAEFGLRPATSDEQAMQDAAGEVVQDDLGSAGDIVP